MDPDSLANLIEEHIEDATAEVAPARGAHDEDHLMATVVSETFDGLPLVQQHQAVYEALGDHMTTDVHALELKTYTPAEYNAHKD